MKKNKKEQKKGWLNKKIADPKFQVGFKKELKNLAIGEQLAKLRVTAGLTQLEVAKKAGTTASAISRYESFEYDRYELKTLLKIVSACGGNLEITVRRNDPKNDEESNIPLLKVAG